MTALLAHGFLCEAFDYLSAKSAALDELKKSLLHQAFSVAL